MENASVQCPVSRRVWSWGWEVVLPGNESRGATAETGRDKAQRSIECTSTQLPVVSQSDTGKIASFDVINN